MADNHETALSIEALRIQVVQDVAYLKAAVELLTEQTREDRAKAQDDRTGLQREIGILGGRMVDLVNEVKRVHEALANFGAKHDALHNDVQDIKAKELMVSGAVKFAAGIKQVLWIIGSMVASFIAALATFFGLLRHPPPQ